MRRDARYERKRERERERERAGSEKKLATTIQRPIRLLYGDQSDKFGVAGWREPRRIRSWSAPRPWSVPQRERR